MTIKGFEQDKYYKHHAMRDVCFKVLDTQRLGFKGRFVAVEWYLYSAKRGLRAMNLCEDLYVLEEGISGYGEV